MKISLNWLEKCLVGLLVLLDVLFLYYWIGLSANYCMHYDDVHFMWKMCDYSIFEFVKEMYMTRGGNFITYTLDGILFNISNWLGVYRFWPMVFYVVGILITWGVFMHASWMKNSKWLGLLGIVTLSKLVQPPKA